MVSTPIGNLGDLTHRAAEILRSAAAILAEDTRRTRQLLDHYGIRTPMVAYHEHNEARSIPRVLDRLTAGEDLAIVSDAGTPLLSDPGLRLVRAAIGRGIAVVPVPGASALLAALVAAGFDAERFTYFGFLPRQGRSRSEALRAVGATPHVAVLYEAPQRVAGTLRALAETAGAGERSAVVARELTKRFEEFRRGTVAELAAYYEDAPPRGEVVLLLGPEEKGSMTLDESELSDRARSLFAEGLSVRDVARRLVEDHGAARNVAYRVSQKLVR